MLKAECCNGWAIMRAKKTSTADLTVLERLRSSGLRPTRQRLALAKLLFSQGDRHVTAEALFNEAKDNRVDVSLATVYNALHDFTGKDLLREISIDSSRSYFDTNVGDHYHFYFETSGRLMDIPAERIAIANLPEAPGGAEVARVDVIIRIKD
jgi:Fur family iron response transcriptional regulator